MNNTELTENYKNQESKRFDLIKHILAVVVIIVIVLKNVIRIPILYFDTSISIYMFFIPVLFFIYLIKNRFYIKTTNKLGFDKNRIIFWIPVFGLFWLLYGIILLVIHNDNYFNGIKELVFIALGFMSILCVFELMETRFNFRYMINALVIVYCLVVIFSFIEILTGYHLSTSMFEDKLNPYYIPEPVFYRATAIFYNPNDLAAFLTFFFPFLFIAKSSDIWKKVGLHIIMGLAIIIILLNDAWIALSSLLIVGVISCIIVKPKILTVLGYSLSLFLIYKFGPNIITSYDNVATVDDLVMREMSGVGSFELRANTYLFGLKATISDTFALGFGPKGFDSVNKIFGDAILMNPHSYIIELFSQYGILVFAGFVFFYLYILLNLIKLYSIEKDTYYLKIILVFIVYPLVTFSPSTFLTTSYQWIPVAWGIHIVWNHKKQLIVCNNTKNLPKHDIDK